MRLAIRSCLALKHLIRVLLVEVQIFSIGTGPIALYRDIHDRHVLRRRRGHPKGHFSGALLTGESG